MKQIKNPARGVIGGFRRARLFGAVSVLAMGLLFAVLARAQDSQFLFDATGNLRVQTAASAVPPQILGQPQNQVVAPGDSASFSVVVADTRVLTYQWRFNGADIFGATTDALLLQNVGTNDVGQYSVVLVNGSGSVTSAPAALMLDSRGCGMPDSWQLAYFGNLTNNATGDYDHDGVSNLQEFLDGTNPTNSASARYRLTVLGNGGSVQVDPLQLSYTNGQLVTLTATAFAPYTFRGWAGDISTTNNPVTLAMTNNKSVFAYLGPLDINWTNSAGGDWNVAANWNPTIVPGMYDRATIAGSITVAVNTNADCDSLTLGSSGLVLPTLTGSGTLTLHGSSTWVGGTMSGSGRTVVAPGGTLTVASAFTLSLTSRTLENGGTVVWTGADIALTSAVITNRAGALFDFRNAVSFNFQGGTERFDNAGIFRKSANLGVTTFFCPFNNSGSVDLQTGGLAMLHGGTNSGSIAVQSGATLNLAGTFISDGASSITGAGNFIVSGGTATLAGLVNVGGTNLFSGSTANLTGNYICTNNTLAITGGTANFDGTGVVSPAVFNLSGTLGGANLVTVGAVMNWTGGGIMSGSGRTVIAPGATLNEGSVFTLALTDRTLENGGTVLWTGGGLYLTRSVITNCAGSLFVDQNDDSFSYQGGAPRIDNAGTFRKELSTGATTFAGGVPFNNYGTLDIRSGFVVANSAYNSTGGSVLSCAIGGTSPGTGFGQLQVSGAVTLSGALRVDLVNGFLPATNATFTILTAGTRSGAFASFSYPSNQVTMQLSNTANSVIVSVSAVAIPPPLFLSPVLSGSNILLSWTAVPNATYRLEFSPYLIPSNWNAVSGDVTSLSNLASKIDTLTPSNRFYRVRVMP